MCRQAECRRKMDGHRLIKLTDQGVQANEKDLYKGTLYTQK